MTPHLLQSWRARMGWTAKRAAQELGLSVNGYAAYERGYAVMYWGPGESPMHSPRPIPRHVAMACQLAELQKESTL